MGGGTTGLFTAIVLARAGHDIVLVEKDERPRDIDATTVAEWQRPGTPHAHLPHAVVAGGRAVLAERLPDVLAAMFAAGAVDFDFAPFVPGGVREPADDLVRAVFCRRPLLENVLWRAAERERAIELRCATTVTAVGDRVVATDRGELRAELIVDAGGRRSSLARAGAGEELVEETAVVYYSRYYRLHPGAELPRGPWTFGPRAELPFAVGMVHLADRGVYSITFAVPTFDPELKAMRDPRAFAAVCGLLPAFAPWADPERAEPVGDVVAMGGLQNVLRARPSAPGVVAVGDSLCHTNAAYGWGISLGMRHAAALADTLAAGATGSELGREYLAAVLPDAHARWTLSAQLDRARARRWRGEPAREDDLLAAVMPRLAPATLADATVFRAMMRVNHLLASPDELLAPELVEYARAASVAPPPAPPSRAEALAAIRAAVQSPNFDDANTVSSS